jgi:hypothetical protein
MKILRIVRTLTVFAGATLAVVEPAQSQTEPQASGDAGAESNQKQLGDPAVVGLWLCQSIFCNRLMLLQADGTFEHRSVATGPSLVGTVISIGRYTFDGNQIRFFEVRETFIPGQGEKRPGYEGRTAKDFVYNVEMPDTNTLLVPEVSPVISRVMVFQRQR